MDAWTLNSALASEQRDKLAEFWLAAPVDILEQLWNSNVGDATRQLVARLTPTTFFTPAQIQRRNQLGEQLQKGLNQPVAIQCMIANFLYSPPGKLRIANPESNLPGWLLQGYRVLYEQGQVHGSSSQAVAAPQAAPQTPPTPITTAQPDFGAFPETLASFASNRIQLNRLLGLSNLYYIDPEDQEILQELRNMRSQLAGLILNCPESELEALFGTDLSDRYWALVRSGVQKEPLLPQEEQLKTASSSKLQPAQGGGFGQPGALNAFLVAMTFFEPGSMRVANAETQLPGWLFQGYQDVFAQAIQS